MLLAATAILPVWQDLAPARARQQVLADNDPSAAQIERHFIVGYSTLATARELVDQTHVGGIFLTRRNVLGRSASDVAAEVASLQAIRHKAGLPPLIVTTDQEGGPVSHLSPPLAKPPSLATLATLPPASRRAAARELGNQIGAQLKSLSVTMDLAPRRRSHPREPAWRVRLEYPDRHLIEFRQP
jgi:beta-N-acetylhexosaminidase